MAKSPAIKMQTKIQNSVIEMVIVCDVTDLMKMVKVAANKPDRNGKKTMQINYYQRKLCWYFVCYVAYCR